MMSVEARPEIIIDQIGSCGKFQMFLGVLHHLMRSSIVFTMYTMPFIAAVPNWWCGDMAGPHNTSLNLNLSNNDNSQHMNSKSSLNFDWVERDSLQKEDVFSYSLPNRNASLNMTVLRSRVLKSCKSMDGAICNNIVYDSSMKTIISEWDMACTSPWIPSLIASLQMVGLIIGHFVSGQLADLIGRKKPLFISLLILVIGNGIGYLSKTTAVLCIARIILGIGMGFFLTLQFTLPTEVTLARIRPLLVVIPTWNIYACLFALVSYLLPDWRLLHLFTLCMTLPYLATWWFVPESFRWYLSHDRKNDAANVIRYISKVNGKKISVENAETLLKDELGNDITGDSKKYSVIDLFKSKYLLKITCLSAINWFAVGLVSYSIQFAIQALSGSFHLNLFLFNIINVPVTFVTIWLCNAIGRRKTAMLCFTMTTIGALAVGIIQLTNTSRKGALINGFVIFTNIGVGIAWGPVQMMTLELYPTVVRNIGYGFLSMFARIAAVIGPQLAYLDTKVAGIMYFTCGGIGLCCVLCTFALNETKNATLNDKIKPNSQQSVEYHSDVIDTVS